MKRTGIRLLLSFILLTVLFIGSVTHVSAAKADKVTVNITGIGEAAGTLPGYITFSYQWKNIWVYYMQIRIFEEGTPIWASPIYEPSGSENKLKSFQSPPQWWDDSLVVENIVDGLEYTVEVQLYGKDQVPLKNGYASATETSPFPEP